MIILTVKDSAFPKSVSIQRQRRGALSHARRLCGEIKGQGEVRVREDGVLIRTYVNTEGYVE